MNAERNTVSSRPAIPETLEECIPRLLEASDYMTIGNRVIEALMEPDAEREEGKLSPLSLKLMPRVVCRFYGISADLAYERVLLDRYTPYEHRNDWSNGRYLELLVQAYEIGSTIQKLRPPHERKVEFYKMVAVEQAVAIRAAHLVYLRAHRPPGTSLSPCDDCITDAQIAQKLRDTVAWYYNELSLRKSRNFVNSFVDCLGGVGRTATPEIYSILDAYEREVTSAYRINIGPPESPPPLPERLLQLCCPHASKEGRAACQAARNRYHQWQHLQQTLPTTIKELREWLVVQRNKYKEEVAANSRLKEEQERLGQERRESEEVTQLRERVRQLELLLQRHTPPAPSRDELPAAAMDAEIDQARRKAALHGEVQTDPLLAEALAEKIEQIKRKYRRES